VFTLQVQLAYGKGRLTVALPDHTDVITPIDTQALADPLSALRQSLAQPIGTAPLRQLLNPASNVTIVHCDGTRPMPNALVITAISEVLDAVGVPTEQVTLLNALGTHRRNTPAELEQMLGSAALQRYRSLQSYATDGHDFRQVGILPSGGVVQLHHAYVEADVRICLGFIEPHFFAGFSGGPKLVVPGVASQSTVEHVHRATLISSPHATWGRLQANPLWESLYAAAAMAPPTFIINVALNKEKEITAVFAGSLSDAHQAGVKYVQEHAMRRVDQPYDIVVTTNSGYPLDQNLYQSVKGMSAAARIVRQGGAIVAVSECSDGIPDHGAFAQLIRQSRHPQHLLDVIHSPGFNAPDQWQAQILAMICQRASVYLYAHGITAQQAQEMMLHPIDDVSACVDELANTCERQLGRKARICVLPEGPQTIPYLQTEMAAVDDRR
jgi:nickel-dependent lactate racemase